MSTAVAGPIRWRVLGVAVLATLALALSAVPAFAGPRIAWGGTGSTPKSGWQTQLFHSNTGAIDIYNVCRGGSALVTLYKPNGNERNFTFPCDGRGRYVHNVAVPKFSQMRLVAYVLNGTATGWTSAYDG